VPKLWTAVETGNRSHGWRPVLARIQGSKVTEHEIQNAILHELGREPDLTLWRNNTGQMAQELATKAHMMRMLSLIEAGDAPRAADLIRSLLAQPRRYTKFGLCVGSSDIVGIVTSYQQRPSGVFLALEVKTAKGQPTAEQVMFLELVNRRGGVGRVVRSVPEARAAVEIARKIAA
jgi:hypothetical protein